MNFKLLHLYPDLMSLYGEWATIAILRRHLENLGHHVTVAFDSNDILTADFIFMGAGTERSQKAVLQDFRQYGDALFRAASRTPMLFTGTAFELLGLEIIDAKGKRYEGLRIGSFTTQETEKRIVGDVYGSCDLVDAPVVGFMNKCSHIQGVEQPFLKRCDMGFGNEALRGSEGFVHQRVLGTHLTGPLLAKNPALTRFFVTALYEKQGAIAPHEWPAYPHEEQGYQVSISELGKLAQR